MRCSACEQMVYKSEVTDNLDVCTKCGYHFRIDSKSRIKYLVDEDSFQEESADLTSSDPLDFKFRDITYKQRISADEKKSGVKEAMRIGKAFIKGRGVVLAVMEPNFLMGSMGSVVGEKFCLAVDKAIEEKQQQIKLLNDEINEITKSKTVINNEIIENQSKADKIKNDFMATIGIFLKRVNDDAEKIQKYITE